MAKIAAVMASLILFAVWGWVAWGEYESAVGKINEGASQTLYERDFEGFVRYVAGYERVFDQVSFRQPLQYMRFSLGLVLSVAFALVYLSTKEGALFSVGLATFFVATAALMHFLTGALIAATEVARIWQGPMDRRAVFDQAAYFSLVLAALLIVASVTAVRRMSGMVKGESQSMIAVVKCMSVLFLVVAPLLIVDQVRLVSVPVVAGYAGLSALSLALIGLTHSNYRYD